VQAGGDVTGAVAANGGDIGTVLAGTSNAPGNIGGALSATRHVKTVKAYGDFTGDIDADQDVNSVTARSIFGTEADPVVISAGRDVKTVKTTGTGAAEGSLAHAEITGGRDVARVQTTRSMTDTVAIAATDRNVVTVQTGSSSRAGDMDATVSAGGRVTRVRAYGSVSGAVEADASVGTVQANGDVTGTITAGTSVTKVQAGRDVRGEVTANGGDVVRVLAGTPKTPGNIEGTLTATRNVRTVRAYGDFTGHINAGQDVNSLTARSILGEDGARLTISAGRDVKTVRTTGTGAGEGSVEHVDIEADRDVKTVNAKDEIASSAITAGRNIGTVLATNDIRGARIEAGTDPDGGNITKVKSTSGDIVDPLIVAGEGPGGDGVYGSDPPGAAADNDVRGGQVRTVEARNGEIRSGDGTHDFVVGGTSVRTVRDRDGRYAASWEDVIIVEGILEQ